MKKQLDENQRDDTKYTKLTINLRNIDFTARDEEMNFK